MKKWLICFIIAGFVAYTTWVLAQSAAGGGAITIATPASGTITGSYVNYGRPVVFRVLTLAWVSDASAGTVTALLPSFYGEIERVITIPTGGGTAPTTLYDITLIDANGADLLANSGQNQSATVTNQFVPVIGSGTGANGLTASVGSSMVLMTGPSTLTITNAGNSKQGSVVIYLKQTGNRE